MELEQASKKAGEQRSTPGVSKKLGRSGEGMSDKGFVALPPALFRFFRVSLRKRLLRRLLELLTDIPDFTSQFYVILKRNFSEWLEWSIEGDLRMRFAIWSLDLANRYFASFKHCF